MNIGEKLEKLMEFIYDEYESDSSFQEFGEVGSTLIEESGIDFGDEGGSQVDAIRLLLEKGWVELVALNGTRIATTRITILSRIKPTPKGIEHVEDRRRPGRAISKAALTVAEIIGRGLKGFFGK
ncbi:MAG: hypothetical protein NT134_04910 [Chloroflexi bacterium]|nr:hypothetical protein [Chloroflexota bacterium]